MTHSYYYTLRSKDETTTWEGSDYPTREAAVTAFNELCTGWINELLPPKPKKWQFWISDIERPDIAKHVY